MLYFFWLYSHKYLRHFYRAFNECHPTRNKFETNFTTICGAERRTLQQFFELWFKLRDSHYILRSRYDRLFPSCSELLVPQQASFLSAVVSKPSFASSPSCPSFCSSSSGTKKSQSDKKFILIFTNFKSFAAYPNIRVNCRDRK